MIFPRSSIKKDDRMIPSKLGQICLRIARAFRLGGSPCSTDSIFS